MLSIPKIKEVEVEVAKLALPRVLYTLARSRNNYIYQSAFYLYTNNRYTLIDVSINIKKAL